MFFVFAIRFSKSAKKSKIQNRIPDGKITYSDLNRPAAAFFSKRYRLTGKPDYIVKTGGGYIPVEFKSGRHAYPPRNHIMQLAAYCQLIEDEYGDFVPHGMLVYNNQDYSIKYDPKLRFDLENVILQMRSSIKYDKVLLNHSNSSKCTSCSMRVYCDNKLI